MRWGILACVVTACTYSPPGDSPGSPSNSGDDQPGDAAGVDPDGPTPTDSTTPPDTSTMAACTGYQAVANASPAGAKYRGVSTRMTWPQARANCQGDGGDLVVVDNDAEGAAIIQLAQDPGPQNSPFIWVGLEDDPNTAADNDFITVRGGPATFTPWGSQQPSGGSQNCVLIGDDSSHDLFDFGCNATQVFVCECLP